MCGMCVAFGCSARKHFGINCESRQYNLLLVEARENFPIPNLYYINPDNI